MTLAPWSAAQRMPCAMPATEPEPRAAQHLDRHDGGAVGDARDAELVVGRLRDGAGDVRAVAVVVGGVVVVRRRSCSRGRTWSPRGRPTLVTPVSMTATTTPLPLPRFQASGMPSWRMCHWYLKQASFGNAPSARAPPGTRPPSSRTRGSPPPVFLRFLVGRDARERFEVDALDAGIVGQLGLRRGRLVGAREVHAVEAVLRGVVADRDLGEAVVRQRLGRDVVLEIDDQAGRVDAARAMASCIVGRRRRLVGRAAGRTPCHKKATPASTAPNPSHGTSLDLDIIWPLYGRFRIMLWCPGWTARFPAGHDTVTRPSPRPLSACEIPPPRRPSCSSCPS